LHHDGRKLTESMTEDFQRLAGCVWHTMKKTEDIMVRFLKERGIPVTRENYLGVMYLSQPPDEPGAEVEAELPEELQCDAGDFRPLLTESGLQLLRDLRLKQQ
jgi:hypothetical protein